MLALVLAQTLTLVAAELALQPEEQLGAA